MATNTVAPGQFADREQICYTLTSTGSTTNVGWARHDDALPAPGIAYFTSDGTPINPAADGFTIIPCAGDPGADIETTSELVCADDAPAIRQVTFTDGIQTAEIFTAANGAVITPTAWTPGPCVAANGEEIDFAETTWCVADAPAVRIDVRNETTGAITTEWHRADGTVFVPTAAELTAATPGACPECCDLVLTEGCWENGANNGTWVSTRDQDGVVTLIDPVTGNTVAAADVVTCTDDFVTKTQTVTADTFTIPLADNVHSWSVRNRTANGTVNLNVDGDITAMDAGETIESEADANGLLTEEVIIDATSGSARVVWVSRI